MIVAGRLARTANGVKLLVELAEALEAPVNDQPNRMNFPSAHPLHNTGNLGNSDLILALEVEDIFMLTHRMSPINRIGIDSPVKLTHNGAKILSISSLELFQRSNYPDFARYNEVGMRSRATADTKRMPISTLERISGRTAVKKPNVTWSRIVCRIRSA